MQFPVTLPRLPSVVLLLLAAGIAGTAASTQAQTCTTTVTGTVTAPNGDVLPNILVYVPTTAVQPFAGSGPGPSCSNPYGIVSGNPLVATTTNAYGAFSLTNAALAGSQTIVIQAGKWRRQFTNVNITACQTTTLPAALAMPSTQSQGDMPHIAVSTGSSDALECVLDQNQMGIANTEFTAPGGGGSINLYAGASSAGVTSVVTNGVTTTLPSETTLMNNPAALATYDLVMFACQGEVSSTASLVADQTNLVNFANQGGRVFATHYNYAWLDKPATFAGTADWIGGSGSIVPTSSGDGTATINTSFADGLTLATWLHYIEPTTTLGQIALNNVKQDQTGVIAPTQSWATLNAPLDSSAIGSPVMQLSFNTPLSAPTTPTVTLSFNNSPASFTLGDAADTIAINVSDTSTTTPANNTLNLTVALPSGLTAVSLAGSGANTGWACSASTLVCNRTTALAAGASDPVSLVVSVSNSSPIGNATVSATIAGGGISSSLQCGRVLFNEYHVETGTGSRTFPSECPTGAMTPQEKFLEYSLYDLSNFVAPVTTDTVNILERTVNGTLAATPEPSAFEGAYTLNATFTPTTVSAQPTGTVTFEVDGVTVGTPTLVNDAASVIVPAGNVELPGTHTLTAIYNGDANYAAYTVTGTHTVSLAPTSVTLTQTTPLITYYGQPIDGTFAVHVLDARYPATGTYTVLDNGAAVAICTNLPLTINGVPNPCPYGNPLFVDAGVHALSVMYNGDPINASSVSPQVVYTVLRDLTSIVLVSSVNPAQPGQSVTFTATVTSNVAIPTGTLTFYDGSTLLSSATLNAAGGVSFTTSSLAVGTHPITAMYAVTTDFNPATGLLNELIEPQVTPLGSSIQLTSNYNPAPLKSTVTFTAAATTTGSFVQIPTGVVSFLDGTTTLGTGTLNSLGIATFQTSTLTAGSHAMTASYAGQTGNTLPILPPPSPPKPVKPLAQAGTAPPILGSVSPVLTQVINTPLSVQPSGYYMTLSPVPFTVAAGQPGILQVQVVEAGGFAQAVALSCSGLPAETACTFTTPTLPAGGGTTTLYVLPQGPHSCATPSVPYYSSNSPLPMLPLTAPLVAGLGFVFSPGGRRRLRKALVATAVAGTLWLSGCGNCTDLGVRPGSFTFTVTATPQGTGAAAPQSISVGMQVIAP